MVAVKKLDPETLVAASGQTELSKHFRLPSKLRLPKTPESTAGSQEWLDRLREFHLTGQTAPAAAAEPEALLPLVLTGLQEAGKLDEAFPYYLPAPDARDESPAPLLDLLTEIVALAGKGGADFAILEHSLDYVAQLVGEEVQRGAGIDEACERAVEQARTAFDLSAAGQAKLEAELKALRGYLPTTGQLTSFTSPSWLRFYAWVAEVTRSGKRKELLERVRALKNRVDALLQADRAQSAESRSPKAVASSIGDGAAYLNADALARVMLRSSGSKGLGADRRTRLQHVASALGRFATELQSQQPIRVIHSGDVAGLEDLPSCRSIVELDPFRAAETLTAEMLQQAAPLFQAMRTAELEVEGRYDAAVHGSILSRFSWESCEADELQALPLVLVVESASRLEAQEFGSFNRLVRSGMPVHIVLTTEENVLGEQAAADSLAHTLPDWGFLAIAHREAFVLQASLARPDQLLGGLEKLFQTLLPAVAVLALPAEESQRPFSWWRSLLAHYSRSFPSFRYNPDRGETWFDRFTLEGNETPESDWLAVDVAVTDDRGGTTAVTERITFAHGALLDPRFRRHFCWVPVTAWSDELVELADYLKEYVTSPPDKLPFLWAVDADGQVGKVVVTREMATACRDRARAWRSLQELAGWNNAHVQAAVQAAREQTEQSVRTELEAAIAAARTQGATEAVDRLIALFTNPAAAALPAPAEGAAVAPVLQGKPLNVDPIPGTGPVASSEKTGTVPVETAPAEEELVEESYIDSFLCSSCNDCINLNPLMFGYNSDKQAVIADESAGTYAQLVKAAEGCPAGCIHPGSPRPGDETATPAVMARAKALR